MRKPRQGRISIGTALVHALRNEPGIEHPRLVTKALKAEEARTLRACSTRLRKEASKQRAADVRSDHVPLRRAKANAMDDFADKFLHEAQALEKK